MPYEQLSIDELLTLLEDEYELLKLSPVEEMLFFICLKQQQLINLLNQELNATTRNIGKRFY